MFLPFLFVLEQTGVRKPKLGPHECNMRVNRVVGGISHFDLVKIPPQPKHISHWTIRQGKEIVKFTKLGIFLEEFMYKINQCMLVLRKNQKHVQNIRFKQCFSNKIPHCRSKPILV